MAYQKDNFDTEKAAAMTLADLLVAVWNSDHPIQARRNMKSAINSVCRAVGMKSADIPADADRLSALLTSADHAAAGIGDVRWTNVKSDFRRALRLVGLKEEYVANISVSGPWAEVTMLGANATERSALRRWARFCDTIGIQPVDVSDAEVEAFRDMLEAEQLSKIPNRIIGDLIRLWTRLADANPHLDLPHLTKIDNSRTYTLKWSTFPESLEADVVAFCSPGSITDWFDLEHDRKPFSPETSFAYNRYLKRLASVMVHAGADPASLKTLGDVATPKALKKALAWLIERNGGKPNTQVHYLAVLCLKIARHWAKLDDKAVEELAVWASRFSSLKQRGMTEKNRARLRQFTGGEVLSWLINLPETIFAELTNKPVTPARARLARDAVIVAILTAAPMRLKNLRHLDLAEHFRPAFSIAANCWELVLKAEEVKNDIDLAYPVPPEVMAMIECYMSKYQPLLAGKASTKLFPGGRGADTFGDGGARMALGRLLKRRLGIEMNPHLFRHLSAFIFLKAHPGQYEPVRRLLGHKNIQTTIDFYASFDTDEAMKRYGSILRDFRKPEEKD
jgi:integrase